MLRILCLIVAWLSAALGTAGIFLPLLPTVPLYLLAALCFAKHQDHRGEGQARRNLTELYKKNNKSPIHQGESGTCLLYMRYEKMMNRPSSMPPMAEKAGSLLWYMRIDWGRISPKTT